MSTNGEGSVQEYDDGCSLDLKNVERRQSVTSPGEAKVSWTTVVKLMMDL